MQHFDLHCGWNGPGLPRPLHPGKVKTLTFPGFMFYPLEFTCLVEVANVLAMSRSSGLMSAAPLLWWVTGVNVPFYRLSRESECFWILLSPRGESQLEARQLPLELWLPSRVCSRPLPLSRDCALVD